MPIYTATRTGNFNLPQTIQGSVQGDLTGCVFSGFSTSVTNANWQAVIPSGESSVSLGVEFPKTENKNRFLLFKTGAGQTSLICQIDDDVELISRYAVGGKRVLGFPFTGTASEGVPAQGDSPYYVNAPRFKGNSRYIQFSSPGSNAIDSYYPVSWLDGSRSLIEFEMSAFTPRASFVRGGMLFYFISPAADVLKMTYENNGFSWNIRGGTNWVKPWDSGVPAFWQLLFDGGALQFWLNGIKEIDTTYLLNGPTANPFVLKFYSSGSGGINFAGWRHRTGSFQFTPGVTEPW